MKQGTDAALAMAFGHVILNEFHVKSQTPYFIDYGRKYTDFPFLVRLKKQGDRYCVPERFLRASDFDGKLGEANNPGLEDRRRSTRRRAMSSARRVRSASAGAKKASGTSQEKVVDRHAKRSWR